jgi:hypothetical protein
MIKAKMEWRMIISKMRRRKIRTMAKKRRCLPDVFGLNA